MFFKISLYSKFKVHMSQGKSFHNMIFWTVNKLCLLRVRFDTNYQHIPHRNNSVLFVCNYFFFSFIASVT